MTDVVDNPPDPLPPEDRRRDRSADRKDRVAEDRRRDREPRDRRDEKVAFRGERDDRPPRRDQHEKRPSIEERLGPGTAVERRDRGRENKRRKSPSLSPFSHRDRERRFSPLRRTPPYKRSRRDEDHETGRKGASPRENLLSGGEDLGRATGFAGDRRYRYDAMVPYEPRGSQGSVHGGDERAQGRHGVRSGFNGGHSDWPGAGRTGFSDGPHGYGASPARREGLMSYKQFIAELEDDILPAEAERRYDEYKAEFITTQKRVFFEQNRDEDWLREKYDPSRLEAVLIRRNENAKTLAKEFQTDLQAGSLDIGPSAVAGLSVAKDEQVLDEEINTHVKRRKPSHTFPRDREFDAAPKAPAALGDMKRISKDVEQARSVIQKLDGEKGIMDNMLLTSGNSNVDGEKVMSGVSVGTIVIIRGPNQVKGLEGLELMDVILTYLWRVHALDYYGLVELKDPPKGLRHVRALETKGVDESALQLAAVEWERKLDAHWQTRIRGQDRIEAMLGRDKLEATANEALDPFVRKIRDEKYGWKYGCGAKGCTKLFHGPEYVHKHLKLKHCELVSDVITKAREELYFQNYMSDPDPDAPGMNQAISGLHGLVLQQRDKNRRRRSGGACSGGGPLTGVAQWMSNERNPNSCLPLVGSSRGSREGSDRFERGGVCEKERSDRISHEEDQRFDRGGERSPSRGDFASGLGGGPPYDGGPPGSFEAGPSDTQMFDPFNGPHLRGPPFGSDIPPPPPVLMPVPGAGPLGPFVPAPPEVAMRMLREQGGPPPFLPGAFDSEGNGGAGPRGRKGRVVGTGGHGMNTGMMDNPPMTVPLTQTARHDPRNVRSYHDLDAPEDEVTVIDYRSL